MSQTSLPPCEDCSGIPDATTPGSGWELWRIHATGIYHLCDVHTRDSRQLASDDLTVTMRRVKERFPGTSHNLRKRMSDVLAAAAREDDMSDGTARETFVTSIAGGDVEGRDLVHDLLTDYEENENWKIRWKAKVQTEVSMSTSATA